MKVHFVTSRASLENDIASQRQIVKAIKEQGHNLAREWLEDAHEEYSQSGIVSDDWASIFKANLETIAQADVIIAETTHESFAVGYIIAVAVQQKKPVLLLRHIQAEKDAFVTGVENGWIVRQEYNDENVDKIVGKFLEDNDIKSKDMRFNFFIDRPIYNYLRWAAFKTGKTKAEILRELVEREIERESN